MFPESLYCLILDYEDLVFLGWLYPLRGEFTTIIFLYDFDYCWFRFRYDIENGKRYHNKDWIDELKDIYIENIKKIYKFNGESFNIYIMERSSGYAESSKNIYKDGIHIIFYIPMNHQLQLYLRDKIIKS